MLGAIAGDVIGSTREWAPVSSLDFELFEPHAFPTDDSILTVAVAAWLLGDTELVPAFKDAVRRYPGAGWGGRFHAWGDSDDTEPYGSFGNGAAMRVSPVGFAASSIDEALDLAAQSAAVTHDHPEGIKGAQATALAIFMARNRAGKDLPGLRPRGHHSLPRRERLRRHHPPRHRPRRRRRHRSQHRRRHSPGVLRGRTWSHPRAGHLPA